jgi:hypothetical protein
MGPQADRWWDWPILTLEILRRLMTVTNCERARGMT